MKSTQQHIDEGTGVGFGGRHGFTREELEKHTGDASICPKSPDTLYPMHDWSYAVGALKGQDIRICLTCGLAGIDLEDSGYRTLDDCIDDLRATL